MNIISDEIDFSKFEKDYPEKANVLPAYAFSDVVRSYFHGELGAKGLPLPWSKTHGKIAFRPGEVSIWSGTNGHGKSLLLNLVILQAIKHGEPCVIASMEMKPHLTMARMTRQASGAAVPSDEFIDAFHEWTEGCLWLYDQQGTVNAKRILSVIRYCHEALKHKGNKVQVRHMVIDSLMKCGVGVDDYNGQKSFLDNLCAMAKLSGIHIHLVAHSRKGDTEHRVGDKFDIAGHADITNQADNVFTVWRNKAKERAIQEDSKDEDVIHGPDALLICSKQRHGEWEGRVTLWFDKASMQYVAGEGNRPLTYFEYSREAQA